MLPIKRKRSIDNFLLPEPDRPAITYLFKALKQRTPYVYIHIIYWLYTNLYAASED